MPGRAAKGGRAGAETRPRRGCHNPDAPGPRAAVDRCAAPGALRSVPRRGGCAEPHVGGGPDVPVWATGVGSSAASRRPHRNLGTPNSAWYTLARRRARWSGHRPAPPRPPGLDLGAHREAQLCERCRPRFPSTCPRSARTVRCCATRLARTLPPRPARGPRHVARPHRPTAMPRSPDSSPMQRAASGGLQRLGGAARRRSLFLSQSPRRRAASRAPAAARRSAAPSRRSMQRPRDRPGSLRAPNSRSTSGSPPRGRPDGRADVPPVAASSRRAPGDPAP